MIRLNIRFFASFASSSLASSSSSSSSSAADPPVGEGGSVRVQRAVGTAEIVVRDAVEVAAESAESALEGARNSHLERAFSEAPREFDAEDGADDDLVVVASLA